MPELPEVETVRRQFVALVVGERLCDIEVTGRRTIRRQPIEEFRSSLTGRTITDMRRWGKFLLADLDDHRAVVIHLRMSGQLRYVTDPSVARDPHTHVVIGLGSGAQLRFVDPRTFGELFVADDLDALGLPPELTHLGIDPVAEQVTSEGFSSLCYQRRLSIKSLLLDQRAIAGIGNIYGDEICALARVRPDRRVGTLTKPQRNRLVAAIPQILNEAIQEHGSSLIDLRYRDLTGGFGTYQDHHRVYGRAGQPCQTCSTPIRRIVISGRSAHFCPRCQR